MLTYLHYLLLISLTQITFEQTFSILLKSYSHFIHLHFYWISQKNSLTFKPFIYSYSIISSIHLPNSFLIHCLINYFYHYSEHYHHHHHLIYPLLIPFDFYRFIQSLSYCFTYCLYFIQIIQLTSYLIFNLQDHYLFFYYLFQMNQYLLLLLIFLLILLSPFSPLILILLKIFFYHSLKNY